MENVKMNQYQSLASSGASFLFRQLLLKYTTKDVMIITFEKEDRNDSITC
jgi:hypothetical protein